MTDGEREISDCMVPIEGTWAGLPVFPRVFYGGVRDESKDNNDEQYSKWLEGASVLCADAGKKGGPYV